MRRCQHWRPVRHGFQGRKSEAFIEGRKDKNLGGVIENSQHFNGDEPQEAHIVLHSATNDRAPQVGILREVRLQ